MSLIGLTHVNLGRGVLMGEKKSTEVEENFDGDELQEAEDDFDEKDPGLELTEIETERAAKGILFRLNCF